jgi:hypothetical protein
VIARSVRRCTCRCKRGQNAIAAVLRDPPPIATHRARSCTPAAPAAKREPQVAGECTILPQAKGERKFAAGSSGWAEIGSGAASSRWAGKDGRGVLPTHRARRLRYFRGDGNDVAAI